MLKNFVLCGLCFLYLVCSKRAEAQEYFTKNGRISFFSKAPLENISADNNQVISILNTETGMLRFRVLIKAFHFPKAMMEQHFNTDYLESDKYPYADFTGTLDGIREIDLAKDGTYDVTAEGILDMHGVKKNISTPAKIVVKNGAITGNAVFKVLLKDFNIKIPSVVSNNIAEQIEITVNCIYQKRTSK